MARRGGCLRVGLVLITVPILLGLGALLISNLNRVLTHETADGVIVELVRSTDSDGDNVFAPVYEYAVDGRIYRYQSQVSYGGLLVPELGEVRTILYNPADPTDARVRSTFFLIWLPALFIGVILLIVGFVFWLSRRRSRRNDAIEATTPPWAEPPAPMQTGESMPPWAPPVEEPVSRQRITATFMGTEPSQMAADGSVRYRVKARAEIDGVMHRFRSDWIDDDPTLLFMDRGNTVDVAIDPDDPTSYQVILPSTE